MTESPVPSVSNTRIHSHASSHPQVQAQAQDDKSEKTEKAILLQIQEINSQVAQYRDLLINIGQPRDCPEVREKVRRLRRNCVEACRNTSQLILPQVRRTTDIGIPVDCPNLMLLFYVAQLFLRELSKSRNLIRIVPMDMTEYYETRTGPSNIGNVISQIVLCKQITPNFYEEELCSIQKDSEEIRGLIAELQEFMPQSDGDIENKGEENFLMRYVLQRNMPLCRVPEVEATVPTANGRNDGTKATTGPPDPLDNHPTFAEL